MCPFVPMSSCPTFLLSLHSHVNTTEKFLCLLVRYVQEIFRPFCYCKAIYLRRPWAWVLAHPPVISSSSPASLPFFHFLMSPYFVLYLTFQCAAFVAFSYSQRFFHLSCPFPFVLPH